MSNKNKKQQQVKIVSVCVENALRDKLEAKVKALLGEVYDVTV